MMAPGIFPHGKPRDQQETRGGKPGLRLREIAESHESHGIVGHDSGILEGDQREQEAYAGGDAKFQADGNRIDQPDPQRRQRKREEQHAGEEHEA